MIKIIIIAGLATLGIKLFNDWLYKCEICGEELVDFSDKTSVCPNGHKAK